MVALPVALPPLVGVIAFLFLYGESGFVSRGVMALFRLQNPPWRLAGAGAILLVHAYSMYVYFYLFTRAALKRLTPPSSKPRPPWGPTGGDVLGRHSARSCARRSPARRS